MENVGSQEQMPADPFLETLERIQGLPETNTDTATKVSALAALGRRIQEEWEVRHWRKSEYKSLMSAVATAQRVINNGGGFVFNAPTLVATPSPAGVPARAAVSTQAASGPSHAPCESRLGWLTRGLFAMGRMSHEQAGVRSETLLSAVSQMEAAGEVCEAHGTEMLKLLGAKVKTLLSNGEDGCQRRIQWAREQADYLRHLPIHEAFEDALRVVREAFRMIASGVMCRDHSERTTVFLGSLMSSLRHRYAREESIVAATDVWNNLQSSKTFKEIKSAVEKASRFFATGALLKGHLLRLEADAHTRRIGLQAMLASKRALVSRQRKAPGLAVSVKYLPVKNGEACWETNRPA